MVKQRSKQRNKPDELPPIPQVEEPMQSVSERPEAECTKEPTEVEVKAEVEMVPVPTVPLASLDPTKYVSNYVEVRFRQGESHIAETLKRLHEGLYETAARLSNGDHITSAADAVRWLLEQVSLKSEAR